MAENINIALTVEAWADIVIKNWQRRITELKIGQTGQLYDSFRSEVISNSGDFPERVEFAFNYYGRFVDMGVGRGMPIGTIQQLGGEFFKKRNERGQLLTHNRRAKKWYSSVMYSQAIKLSSIMQAKYGIISSAIIKENINADNARASKKFTGDVANRRTMAQHAAPKSELSELDRVWMRRNGLLND
jgi:hypothetical protein